MQYKINGTIIKSENSAKPTYSPSKDMLALLENYVSKDDELLDFGCGKLRYAIPLSTKVKKVYGVDSYEQINRHIKVNKEKTSVLEISKKFHNIILFDAAMEDWKKRKYDIILLSHVLSSIPDDDDRLNIINSLASVMHEKSILITCTNHRGSIFKKWANSPNIEKYNNGFFIKEPSPSYFGIIDKKILSSYFTDDVFEIVKLFIREDNTYCISKLK